MSSSVSPIRSALGRPETVRALALAGSGTARVFDSSISWPTPEVRSSINTGVGFLMEGNSVERSVGKWLFVEFGLERLSEDAGAGGLDEGVTVGELENCPALGALSLLRFDSCQRGAGSVCCKKREALSFVGFEHSIGLPVRVTLTFSTDREAAWSCSSSGVELIPAGTEERVEEFDDFCSSNGLDKVPSSLLPRADGKGALSGDMAKAACVAGDVERLLATSDGPGGGR